MLSKIFSNFIKRGGMIHDGNVMGKSDYVR